ISCKGKRGTVNGDPDEVEGADSQNPAHPEAVNELLMIALGKFSGQEVDTGISAGGALRGESGQAGSRKRLDNLDGLIQSAAKSRIPVRGGGRGGDQMPARWRSKPT